MNAKFHWHYISVWSIIDDSSTGVLKAYQRAFGSGDLKTQQTSNSLYNDTDEESSCLE